MLLELFSRPNYRLTTALIFTSQFQVVNTNLFQTPAVYLIGKGIRPFLGSSISEPVRCVISLAISTTFFKLIRDASASQGFPITCWTWSQAYLLSICVLVGIVISHLPLTFLTLWYKSLEKEKAHIDKQFQEGNKTLNSQISQAAQEGFDLTPYITDYKMHLLACAGTTVTMHFQKLSEENLEKIEVIFKKLDQKGYSLMKHFKEFEELGQKNERIFWDLAQYKDLIAESTLSALFRL